jgi:predicted exporter
LIAKKLALLWLLIVALLVSYNIHLWLNKRITPNTDILALLPAEQRDPVVQQAFNHMVDAAQQRIIILIGARDWTQATRAADAYTAIINARPDLIKQDATNIDQLQNTWLTSFTKSRLGLLTPAQQFALRTQTPQYWINSALSRLYSPFAGPQVLSWQNDPFGLFSDWIQARAQETPVRPRAGKLFVADQHYSYVVLPMTLQQPAFALSTQKIVIPLLARAQQVAQQTAPNIKIISAGMVLHAAAAGAQASREMSTIGLGSVLGILLLMWLTFRSLKPILLIGLSLIVGCLGALTVCYFIFGQIHLLTLVFGASLIGVAQDYALYFLCSSLLVKESVLQRTLPGLCLTLIAALLGYLGLALTPFPGLQQMAIFSGSGLLFAWLSVICWFPVLVKPQMLKTTRLADNYNSSRTAWPVFNKNKFTLITALLFLIIIIVGLSRLTISDDIRALQKSPPQLINDQLALDKLLDTPTPAQFYLVRGATPEIVLQREELLKQQLDLLINQRLISGYQAISNWVPSLQTQQTNQELVKEKILNENYYRRGERRSPAGDQPVAPTKNILNQLATKIGEDTNWTNNTKNNLLNSNQLLTPEQFLLTPASGPWRYLWLGKTSDGYASIVALRGLNDYANLPKLQQATANISGVQWVDKVGGISAVLGHYRQYMGWVIICAYLAIYLLLALRYRTAAWRVLAPPALASIGVLAVLGIFNIPLQLFHVLAFMLILGLGVDYGIFLQEQSDKYYPWLTVGLSAISALLAFGLLALSNTPPLHAFGLTMLIGMILTWMIAPCFNKKICVN